MIEILERCRKSANPASMAYLNDQLIPVIRDTLAGIHDPIKQIPHRFKLGRQLVLAGDPTGAWLNSTVSKRSCKARVLR